MDLYCTGNLDRRYFDHLFIPCVKLILAQCEKVVGQSYDCILVQQWHAYSVTAFV